jgi:ABC-type nitrate/sulfonate/bicarbonate transport system substrate-binding protein
MRLVVNFGKYLTDFHAAVLFASRSAIDKNPDVVRRFVAASLESIRYMKTHKDETVKLVAQMSNTPESVVARTYDEVIATYSDSGRFDPKALAVLRRSYVQLGLLPEEPDMGPLYTERFLPAGR